MSLIPAGLDTFRTALAAAGLPVVADPRNARTPAVVIDAPSFRSLSPGIAELTIPVYAVVTPPGNLDALDALLDLVDDVVDACTAAHASTVTGQAGTYNLGGKDLPAYNLSVTVTYRKE